MAGTVSIEDILGLAPLTEALRATTSGVPDPFPAELDAVKPANKVMGDRGKWKRIYGTRTTAKLGAYGTEGRRVPLQSVSEQEFRCLYVGLQFQIDMLMLAKLMSFERYVQDEGVDFVRYELEELSKRIANTSVVAKASMLRYGAIYWDADGNILPNSTGAVYTYTAQVPSTNQGQLNGIITAPWTLPNTDILSQLRQLQRQSKKDTGLRLSTAMHGLNMISYFQGNALMQGYLTRNPSWRDSLVDTGMVPDRFAGVDRWVNVGEAFFEDVNGVNQNLWDDDLIVFTPSLNTPDKMDFWATMEGSLAVPRSFDVFGDPTAAMRNFRWEYGEIGYAIPNVIGVNGMQMGVTVHCAKVWLPAIRLEKAVYQAEVVF